MIYIELPWPPKTLSPNGRVHWGAKAKVAKKYRQDCGWIAKFAEKPTLKNGKLPITVTFYPPDRRARDADNLVSSIKSCFDGLADAWKINDKHFEPTYKIGDVIKGGRVTVEVM